MRRGGWQLLLLVVWLGLRGGSWGAPPLPPPTTPRTPLALPVASPTPSDLVFCVFGDTRPAGDPARLRLVSRLAAAMAAERPQVVLGTGDYIDGGRRAETNLAQLRDFLQAFQPLQSLGPVPLAAALGNHDRALGSETLTRVFGPPYYSFDLANSHFVILDTEQPGAVGRIEGKQWEWLVHDLQQARGAQFRFVVLHQPLFPVATYRGKALDRYPLLRDRLHLLFVQEKVHCVFQGHEHLYDRQERDGVNYVITGGGGAPLYAEERQGGFHHYLRVDVTAKAYTVAVKRLD